MGYLAFYLKANIMDPIEVFYDSMVLSLEGDNMILLIHGVMLGWIKVEIPLQVIAQATEVWTDGTSE